MRKQPFIHMDGDKKTARAPGFGKADGLTGQLKISQKRADY